MNAKIQNAMKRLNWFMIAACTAFLACGCNDDEDLSPSYADEDRMEQLIDKSNADIMAFKEKYGTYILYDFDQMKDFAYQFDEAQTWRDATITKLEAEDVQGAVDFLAEGFWARYSDSLITYSFPRKFLIVSKLQAGVLGVSGVDGQLTYHEAAVNMNSYTAANLDAESRAAMDEDARTAYFRQLHYVYIAGYLLEVKRNVFVSDLFFDPSESLYATKIGRDEIVADIDEEFFMSRGFFELPSDENYYPERLEDLRTFVQELIVMDEEMRDKVMSHSLMRIKMGNVVQGLKAIGVDIEKINPLATDFLSVN